MNKLKNKITVLLGDLKPLIEEYKFTFSFIVLGALFMLFLDLDSDFYPKVAMFYFLTVDTTFFIENYIDKNDYSIVFSIIAAIINYTATIYIIDNSPTVKVIYGILGIYFLLGFLSIYKISSKEDFSKYLLDVFSNSIIVSVGLLVIQLGFMFIIFLISRLLFDNLDFDFYVRIELLYLELIALPSYLLSLLYFKKDYSKLLKHLLLSIIVPLLSISLIILYLYLIKIIVMWDIPKNYLFLCVSLYLMVFFPTWFMLEYYENDSKLVKKLRDISFYTFIPLLFVQIYTMGIRILNNGITFSRYYAVLIIIFEIFLFYFIYTKKRELYSNLFLIGGVLIFICFSVPIINCYDASFYSQYSIIKRMVKNQNDFNNLDYDGQYKVFSSVNYIKYGLDMEDKLDDFYLNLHINKSANNDYDDDYYNYKSISYSNPIKKYPTYDYDMFSYYNFDIYSKNDKGFFEVYDNRNDNRKIEKVFYQYIDSFIEKGEVDNYVIKLDDNTLFYIDDITIDYYSNNNEVNYVYVKGFLLHNDNSDKKNN